MNSRDPVYGNSRENYTMLYVIRSIMDAFWIRKNSTVSRNFRRPRKYYFDTRDILGIRISVPIIGTDKVRDRVGMVCALKILDALRRKGKRQDQLQWDSMRRSPTWYNNAREAGEGSYETGDIYLSNEKNIYDSTDPTEIR